ncbi:MAG TPA: hypothetical protein VMC06_09980, partial [Opitutaceae bacterium]|nr:hypothetical protein [Opitutaceae bacterium]
LATAALLERRWRTAAGWVALAWLSHPVGALFLPPLGLLGAHAVWLAERERGTGWRTRAGRALGALAGFAGLTLLLTSPWLGYKLWVGHSDVFMRYPLGDGHGTALAVSLASWARTRWDNLWYTLVPGAFFASDQMSVWIMGPLTASMRWIIQYAKSLPGNLGYAGFGLVAVALMRRPRERPALVWWHLGAGAFALMLLFWGFSSDGLGRNCLEPLSIALLIATAATWSDRHPRLLPLWVGLVGIDSLWVVLGGFASARDFRLSQIDFAAGGWCALDVILTIALLWWSVWVWRNRDRINASVGTAWRGSMPSYRECLAAGRRLLAAWHAYFAAWPRPVQIALGVVLLAIALFLRKPDALLNPQFWAEDGSEFFLKNDQHGLGAWLLPYAGYLHLVPRLVVWAAGFADPRWLPALYSGASFLIWIAVIARCWAPRLELPHKVWLPVAFLFAAHTTEVVFVLTNVIWITAFLLLQQVFMRPPARWWGRMMELALVGIAALTGPFVIILWPLFAWSFWRRRTAYSAMVFTVVSIAGLIQLGCIWYSPTEVNHLAETLATPIEGFARITQWTLALYLGGASFALALSNGVLIGIGIAVLLLWLAVTRRPPVEPAVWWAISYALVAMLAASFYRGSPSGIIGMGDRYYFIPRVLVGWLLIWLAVGDSRRSRVVRFVAVLAICINLPGYRLPPATDYHWAQNCAPLRDGQPARIPILPDGWILQYPGRPMR